MTKRTTLLVPVLLLAGFVGVACGDDDGENAGPTGNFCEAARAIEASNGGEDLLAGETPEEVEAGYRQFTALLDNAVDSAPSELEDELEAIRDAYGALGEGLEEYEWDFFAYATSPEAEETFAELESVDFTPVETYLEETCGIAPES
jgi:hypothetical protein